MWFKPKPPVDLDEFEWLLACFAWVHRTLGEADRSIGYQPVLVRPDTPGLAEAEGAADMFAAIKSLAGLDAWECELRQGEPEPDLAGSGLVIEQRGKRALGTFSIQATEPLSRFDQFGQPIAGTGEGSSPLPVIYYAPELLHSPEALAATFAHELAHLVGHGLGDPPGGEELHEHATDCLAVYMGFGIFLANSARQFSQFQDGLIQGWQSSTSGYLSERALVTLLALFVRLFEQDSGQASAPLKPYLRADFAKALKYIDRRYPNIGKALDELDLAEWGLSEQS
ncbi:MAG: hypothetical protein RL299_1493 [Pseudomonadota bacterium]